MSEHHRTPEWTRVRRVMKPRLAAEIEQGLGQCVNCGRVIEPGTPQSHWQVGHRIDAAILLARGWTEYEVNHPDNLGPSHSKASGRACNQIAGGKAGAAKTNAQRATNPSEIRRPSTW